jgi:pilus assembly protein CpaF
MFGRRQNDLPDARRGSPAAPGPSPLLSHAEGSPGGRSFGRRKDDSTIRVMHMPQQVAADMSEPGRSAGAPTIVTRASAPAPSLTAQRSHLETVKDRIHPKLMNRMDVTAASALPREELKGPIAALVSEILFEEGLQLNAVEQREIVGRLLDDMLGLGPLEPLLADETITDIMVNGPDQIYVERRGKLELTDVNFRDDQHLMNICTKIVTRIGRRIDESRPLVDARLPDGSRVNIIIPPLAIDGASISIRKFSKKSITLDVMAANGSISGAMATLLKIAARCRLNVLISGGTGSGKTTLLNALSRMIDGTERTVTIEDAAELQLQQPHVVRLETRTANLEGTGEITMRDRLKNALRMRPDRIIIGECRGEEALDMLQAMNTGHDGSMSTIHANNPREALTRVENMISMSCINLATKAMRTQIA